MRDELEDAVLTCFADLDFALVLGTTDFVASFFAIVGLYSV